MRFSNNVPSKNPYTIVKEQRSGCNFRIADKDPAAALRGFAKSFSLPFF